MAKRLGKNPLKEAFFKKSRRAKAKTRPMIREKDTTNRKRNVGIRKGSVNLDKPKIETTAQEIQVIVFYVGNEYFGIDIRAVEEIVQMVEVTDLPKSPDFVDGIIDVRGRIVPLMNLRRMLQLEEKPHDLNTEIIIANIENTEIGLVVDRVQEMVTLQKEQILFPDEKTVPLAKFLVGVASLEKGLLPLLDLVKVLNFEQRALLKKIRSVPRSDAVKLPGMKDKEREILRKRAMELGKRKIEDEVETRRLVTFSLGNEWYGIDIDRIREITDLSDIYYIPSSPEYVVGAINQRGDIISVIDLRKLFTLPDMQTTRSARIIIIEHDPMTIGFIVDAVADVVALPVNVIEPPLITLERIKADFLEGEAKRGDRLIGLLNLKGIVTGMRIGE